MMSVFRRARVLGKRNIWKKSQKKQGQTSGRNGQIYKGKQEKMVVGERERGTRYTLHQEKEELVKKGIREKREKEEDKKW